MITINQPKIVAQEQIIKFDECHITGGARGDLRALVSFVVENENGERIDNLYIEYSGSDYNQFWTDFNSGKFLFDELVKEKGLEVDVPNEVEQEFLNETM